MELSIQNICKTYANGVRALKNASFTILSGLDGLSGTNGAAKNTLVRILVTLRKSGEDNTCPGDIDVLNQQDRLRKTPGYLPHEFTVYPKGKAENLLETEPLRSIAELRGRIWRRVVEKGSLPELEREYAVISKKLLAGRAVVHVYSDDLPGRGFESVEPDLEDVYFSTIAGFYGQAEREVAL